MIKLRDAYKQRDMESEEKLKDAFEFRNKKAPVIINDVNYWLFGEIPEDIPDGYCDKSPEIMLNYQIKKIKRHYDSFSDDCYMGFLMPWFGTGVLASGFGTNVICNEKMDPAVDMSTISDPKEIMKLRMPDFYNDGLMPRVLNTIDYFKRNCDLPVGVTDCQGPLTTALSIIGYENFIYWMYDYPNEVHELMEKVTEALIEWVKVQKKHAGESLEKAGYIIGAKMPEGYGGVWIADDDSVIFGTDLYKEFVVPYNSKLLKAFGGGGIHYCGNSTQHIENFLSTDGLTCINNFNLDNIENAAAMKKGLEKKGIPYMVCDFVPDDSRMENYYSELFSRIPQEGLIVVSYVAPAISLNKGKYEAYRRDQLQLARKVKDIIFKARG